MMKSLKSLDVIARNIVEAGAVNENQVLQILRAREAAVRADERKKTKSKTVKGVINFLKQEASKSSSFAQMGLQTAADRIRETFKD